MSRWGSRAVLAALIVLAIGLRAHRLGDPTLWVDEAESALNALTIVADGVPGDTYLGQPLYENTMLRPWPGHPEYEFRDLSYSDRGLAVYHSWLPLYSIAAAFRLVGVTPEAARRGPPIRGASHDEVAFWTAVPRAPALLYSALFVLAVWRLGKAFGGESAALAAAFAAASANFFVFAGRQARYYSAALAFDALCGLAIWVAWRRGHISDHLLAGLAIGVLFHVHSVTAVAMVAVYVLSAPLGRRQPGLLVRLVTAGGAAGTLVLPWALWSGMLGQAVRQPQALSYLDPRMVLWSLPSNDPFIVATFAGGFVWLMLALRRDEFGQRWRAPIVERRAALYFVHVWLVTSYVAFIVLMPAASFATFRFRLLVSVPGLLVLALFIDVFWKVVRPAARFAPAVALAGLLLLAGQLPVDLDRQPDPEFEGLIAELRAWSPRQGRIYASPNDHLVLTYYTGRPVQSVAAVRREWLERYVGDLLVVEAPPYDLPPPEVVRLSARQLGITLTANEATAARRQATLRATALDLERTGAPIAEIPRVAPATLESTLVDAVRTETARRIVRTTRGTPLGREAIPTWREYRHLFFLGFVSPQSRDGAGLNYARCRATGRVRLHPSRFTLFECAPGPREPAAPAEAP